MKNTATALDEHRRSSIKERHLHLHSLCFVDLHSLHPPLTKHVTCAPDLTEGCRYTGTLGTLAPLAKPVQILTYFME